MSLWEVSFSAWRRVFACESAALEVVREVQVWDRVEISWVSAEFVELLASSWDLRVRIW